MSENLPAVDKALKLRLQGLTVSDLADAARPVNIWFRNPQKEAETAVFPYVTILFEGVQRDEAREHRKSPSYPNYIPSGVTVDDDPNTVLSVQDEAIPYVLRYSIMTHCKNPMHDRELVEKMLAVDRLPLRYGYLEVEDNTIRRLDVSPNVPSRDFYDQNGQQVFRKEWTVMVSGEQYYIADDDAELTQAPKPSTVVTTFTELAPTSDYVPDYSQLTP